MRVGKSQGISQQPANNYHFCVGMQRFYRGYQRQGLIFPVPDLRIDQRHGPIPIESTARKLDEDFDFSNSPVCKFWDRIKDNDEYTDPSSPLDDFAKILAT